MTFDEAVDKITDTLDGNGDGTVSVYASYGPELTVTIGEDDGDQKKFKVTIEEI